MLLPKAHPEVIMCFAYVPAKRPLESLVYIRHAKINGPKQPLEGFGIFRPVLMQEERYCSAI